MTTVNAVLGDASFIWKFGRLPDATTDEDLRLRTHLEFVEHLLRSRSVDHLSPEDRQNRTRSLDLLHEYWTAGVFPRNYDYPGTRRPVFIDRDGRICAVGYLLEQTLGREAAEGVNTQYKHAFIEEMDAPVLEEWLAQSGLTLTEAAMIQPGYEDYGYWAWWYPSANPDHKAAMCGSDEAFQLISLGGRYWGAAMTPFRGGTNLSCVGNQTEDTIHLVGFTDTPNLESSLLAHIYGAEDAYVALLSIVLRAHRSIDGPDKIRIWTTQSGSTVLDKVYDLSTNPPNSSIYTGPEFYNEGIEDTFQVALQPFYSDPTAVSADGVFHMELLSLDGWAGTTLPIELTTFAATTEDGEAALSWQTASETDNAGFEIQHYVGATTAVETLHATSLQDGDAWQALAFIEGHGTTTEAHHYTHRVPDLPPGTHRFRLKQIDFDGAFSYSPVVEVIIEAEGRYTLSAAYPNPFDSGTTFTLTLTDEEHVRIEVYDAMGRRVEQLYEGALQARVPHRFSLDGHDLSNGLYMVQVRGERFQTSRSALRMR